MKYLLCTFIGMLTICTISAQDKFAIPNVTADQEKEILYNHAMAYFATGISFAKTKGVSPGAYGKYVGEQFKPFWNPDQGFEALGNTLMFFLKGMHPNNEMQIVEQSDNLLCFKLKNVDALFQNGPAYGISYEDFLQCSKGILETIAIHMNSKFEHKIDDQGWYIVKLKGS